MARLVLLPLGTFLLYQGVRGQWIALVAMTIVGCTDFVDGWLARKYGPTVLGGLMDPIADKMFIALTMLPALDLGWLPSSIVALIFLREFVVTALRTAYSRRDVTLKTSYISKVKTWYQMIVSGLLFLLGIDLGDHGERVRTVLLVGTIAAAVFGVLFYAIRRRPWRGSIAFFFSFGALFVVATQVTLPILAQTLGWVTVAITWWSGAAYLFGLRGLPGTARFDAHDAVRLFGAVSLPLIACALIGMHVTHAWPVFVTVALEFAIGGLDNLLAHHKRLGDWRAWAVRSMLQAGLLGGALIVAARGGPAALVFDLGVAALIVTAIFAVHTFYANRSAYLDAETAAKPLVA